MQRDHRSAVLLSVVITATACSSVDIPSAPHVIRPSLFAARAQVDSAAAGRKTRGIEEEWLKIEARVPGFGGLYRDTTSGKIVAFLIDTNQAPTLRAAVAEVDTLFPDAATRLAVGAGSIEVRRGTYAFSELVAWQQRIAALNDMPGFVSVDADEGWNRVTVGLETSASRIQFSAVAEAAGIPSAAIRFVNARVPTFASDDLRGFFPSGTGGGVQITNADFPATGLCTEVAWEIKTV